MNLNEFEAIELTCVEQESLEGGVVFFLMGIAFGFLVAEHYCDCNH